MKNLSDFISLEHPDLALGEVLSKLQAMGPEKGVKFKDIAAHLKASRTSWRMSIGLGSILGLVILIMVGLMIYKCCHLSTGRRGWSFCRPEAPPGDEDEAETYFLRSNRPTPMIGRCRS